MILKSDNVGCYHTEIFFAWKYYGNPKMDESSFQDKIQWKLHRKGSVRSQQNKKKWIMSKKTKI